MRTTPRTKFCFLVKLPMKSRTRRGLSTANFLFDPFGFLAPCIYRSAYQHEIEWDELMPKKELRKWEMWLSSLSQLQHVALPRCLILSLYGDMERCQLNYFADASITAYCVVCFLRSLDNENNILCSFIMPKSQLAPQDEVSPVKLDITVKKELDLRPSIV